MILEQFYTTMLYCRYNILVCEAIQQHLRKYYDSSSYPSCLCLSPCRLMRLWFGRGIVGLKAVLPKSSIVRLSYRTIVTALYSHEDWENQCTLNCWRLRGPWNCSYKHGLLDLAVYVISELTDNSVQTLPESCSYDISYLTHSFQRSKPDNAW